MSEILANSMGQPDACYVAHDAFGSNLHLYHLEGKGVCMTRETAGITVAE